MKNKSKNACNVCLQVAKQALELYEMIKQSGANDISRAHLREMSQQLDLAKRYLKETMSADVGSVSMPLGGPIKRKLKEQPNPANNMQSSKQIADKLKKSGNNNLANKISKPGNTMFNREELDAIIAAKKNI